MYHYDPNLALEELQEDALLPHPVKLRDMILRTKLEASQAQLLNHDFQDYLTRFGELQKLGRGILERLATGQRKRSEEHTSELQSRLHLVCRLLLEKKKNKRFSTLSAIAIA